MANRGREAERARGSTALMLGASKASSIKDDSFRRAQLCMKLPVSKRSERSQMSRGKGESELRDGDPPLET